MLSKFLWALLIAAPFTGAAQDAAAVPEPATFRSDVDLISLAVRVSDRADRDVAGLSASQFTVYENRVAQKIAFFSAEQQPLSLGILLDVSGSMAANGKLDEAKQALAAIVNAGHPDNEWLFLRFHRDVETVTGFTSDRSRVLAAIAATQTEPEGTSVYDAVARALCLLKSAKHPRQALIVITDGADQHSHRTLDELVPLVEAARAQLFLIGCFGKEEAAYFQTSEKKIALVTGQEIDNPRFAFARLAQESGAEYFFATSPGKLQEAVDSIARQLRTQYTLAYYPPPGEGYRRIEVKVASHGLKVRARRGYVLPEAAASQLACDAQPLRPYPYEARVEHSGGCLAYRDDFRTADTGWPQREHYYRVDGAYRLTSASRTGRPAHGTIDTAHIVFGQSVPTSLSTPAVSDSPARAGGGILVANGPWFTDLRAEVTVETKAAGGRQAAAPSAGLAFRVGSTGYYALLLDGSSARDVRFKLVRADFAEAEAHDLLPWTAAPPTASGYAERRTLAVTCKGSKIRVYVQGVLAGEVEDGTLEDGLAGLVLFGSGHADFRDLAVTELCRRAAGPARTAQ